MKFLKWLLGALALLGVVLIGGALLLPSSTHVERTVVIERPVAQVHATLNSFARFNQWSPWFAADPQAKYSYSGPTEGVGARMQWAGTQAVGTGSQTILESAPDKIVVALDFDGSQARATYALAAEGAQRTRVTWSFDSQHGFNPLGRWMGLLFDKMIGGDYERGLAALKTLLEKDAAPR